MNKYNWEGINYPSQKDGWKNFEKNNPTVALNVHMPKKEEKIYPAYVSKHISKREMALICGNKIISIILTGKNYINQQFNTRI